MSVFVVTKEMKQHASTKENIVLNEFISLEEAADYAEAWFLDKNPEATNEELDVMREELTFDDGDCVVRVWDAFDITDYIDGTGGYFEFVQARHSNVAARKLVFIPD